MQQLCCSAALEMPELLAKIAELTAENEVLKRKLESAETTVDAYKMVKRLKGMMTKFEKSPGPCTPADKVDIGGGVLVDKSVLGLLNHSNSGPGKYARALLRHLFSPEELQGSSLFGQQNTRTHSKRGSLYQEKVSAVIGFTCRKFPDASAALIKNSLASYLARLNNGPAAATPEQAI
ncbi:uncharacterized protein LOC144098016 [Amblyomma americanum]